MNIHKLPQIFKMVIASSPSIVMYVLLEEGLQ